MAKEQADRDKVRRILVNAGLAQSQVDQLTDEIDEKVLVKPDLNIFVGDRINVTDMAMNNELFAQLIDLDLSDFNEPKKKTEPIDVMLEVVTKVKKIRNNNKDLNKDQACSRASTNPNTYNEYVRQLWYFRRRLREIGILPG